jgi:restriction system protein
LRLHYHNNERNLLAEGMVRVFGQQEREAELMMKAIVAPLHETNEGTLIEAVKIPWLELAKLLQNDPRAMHLIDWRKWEEMIAGAYDRAGFDEVTLTPRSGDLGRDVIATKKGVGSIRIVDQVKKYKPGRVVTANDVRALFGVVSADPGASKGVITTTAVFAPGVADDPLLKPYMPYRLELRDGPALLRWLNSLI